MASPNSMGPLRPASRWDIHAELHVGLAWDMLSGNVKWPACLVRRADARLAGGEHKEMPHPGLLPGKHAG